LVESATPNMDFDLDNLKNLRIKVMYTQNGEYQNLMAIRPIDGKIIAGKSDQETHETPPVHDDEVPF
jgi:hypothetical protein